MTDWVEKIDGFLQFNEYKILKDAGSVSHEVAKKIAESAYERFMIVRDNNFESVFDKAFKTIKPPRKSS